MTPFLDSKKSLDSQLFRRVAPFGHHQSLEAQAGHGSTPDDRGALSIKAIPLAKAVAARLRDTDSEARKEAVLAMAELAPGNPTQAGSEILGMLCTMPNDFVVQL